MVRVRIHTLLQFHSQPHNCGHRRYVYVYAHYLVTMSDLPSAALVGYDYLLTVRRESRLFWKRRVNTASILFFVNRYIALVYYVGLAYYRCLLLELSVSHSSRSGPP